MSENDLQAQLDEARAWARFYWYARNHNIYLADGFGVDMEHEPAWLTEEPVWLSWDDALYINAMPPAKRRRLLDKVRASRVEELLEFQVDPDSAKQMREHLAAGDVPRMKRPQQRADRRP